jgi:hypothetical protein
MSVLLATWLCGGVHAKEKFFDYETFQSLTALVPEVKNPRPVGGMTEAGFERWTKRKMRLTNPDQYRAEGDFQGDGKIETALPFKSEKGFHLLIAERAGNAWQRKALFALAQESAVAWNGKALALEPQTFVYWDGRDYHRAQGPLATYVYGYLEAELSGVLLKITYIGPQTKPVKGLLLMTYQESPDWGAFRSHHRKDVSYVNDDNLSIGYLTLSSARMRDVLQTLLESPWTKAQRTPAAPDLRYSISVVDTSSSHRPNFFEGLATSHEVGLFVHQAADRIKPTDPQAAKVLRAYR